MDLRQLSLLSGFVLGALDGEEPSDAKRLRCAAARLCRVVAAATEGDTISEAVVRAGRRGSMSDRTPSCGDQPGAHGLAWRVVAQLTRRTTLVPLPEARRELVDPAALTELAIAMRSDRLPVGGQSFVAGFNLVLCRSVLDRLFVSVLAAAGGRRLGLTGRLEHPPMERVAADMMRAGHRCLLNDVHVTSGALDLLLDDPCA